MTYEEFITLYGGNSYSQLCQMARSDSEFRAATSSLYRAINGQPLTVTCSDCVADAALYILKNYTKNKAKMESKYKLKGGAFILRDVRNVNDSARMATRHNITDELALYHLYTNPACVKYFDTLPENWEQEVAEYGQKLDGVAEANTEPTKPTTKKKNAPKKAKK